MFEERGLRCQADTKGTPSFFPSSIAGSQAFCLQQDGPRASSGGLEVPGKAHYVLLQISECQVRGVGPSDTSRAICSQGG